MIRRFGESHRADVRYRLRPGAYAILARDGQVLLTEQSQPWPEIQLPGGGIDPGESPQAALHREVAEETGWRIAGVRRLGAWRRFAYMPEYGIWAEKLCHVYVARPVRSLHPPKEPHHRALWLPLHKATRALGPEGDRHFMARWLRLAGGRAV